MQILPAIDLRGGKCVNLVQGIATQETVFSDAPVEMALQWQSEGAEYLHLVDLDGAFQNESVNLDIVSKIVAALEIPVQLGGGIRSMERLDTVLALGVDRAILGTVALKQPDFVKQACAKYGARIAVGIDAKDGRVATEGWLEVSQKSAVEFAQEMGEVQTLIYTDIKSDGMLKGPNVDATADIINAGSANVIASGGVTSLADIAALKGIGANGAIVGRALYTGDLALSDAIAAAS
ncbi:1-(5-phosphoribosyl)-5-[(5-phosphoribosylamino)methylideneamino]imidazole-4-carboxamide isomerase [Candidatus Poribacteria bacterium]|nr:1-(5-phosphoribosyl)-5-[(5-phosphoribosylamino)methylideneamino]imidazole-4-carboxamide isomerase [Candidatus Poribacteria bacterium]MYK18769.1 1-(5-phosphoribosyl)-5-[(5-phosphoribosylamino)methylideneamino]imidazole-4-carboxamide isomerase [Candidatus Poribacteria bacterium]